MKKRTKKGIFRHFSEKFDQKNRLPLKIVILALKAPLAKKLGSVSQKWMSQNSGGPQNSKITLNSGEENGGTFWVGRGSNP